MKYYKREVTRRDSVNRFGRMGYILVAEYVKTNDIAPFNKGKRIRFTEDKEAKRFLLHKAVDTVYQEDIKTVSKTW